MNTKIPFTKTFTAIVAVLVARTAFAEPMPFAPMGRGVPEPEDRGQQAKRVMSLAALEKERQDAIAEGRRQIAEAEATATAAQDSIRDALLADYRALDAKLREAEAELERAQMTPGERGKARAALAKKREDAIEEGRRKIAKISAAAKAELEGKRKEILTTLNAHVNAIVTKKAALLRQAAAVPVKARDPFAHLQNPPPPDLREIFESMVPIPGKAYWMGKTEVTQKQWEAIMGQGENPSRDCNKSPDRPVDTVSWYACQKFLDTLNGLPSVKESGLVFRLPSEEEWNYACHAKTEWMTGSGFDRWPKTYCKLADGTEITEKSLGLVAWINGYGGMTYPVGQKKPNAFGLYDMYGNVEEWSSTGFDKGNFVLGGGTSTTARNISMGRPAAGRTGRGYGFRLCASERFPRQQVHLSPEMESIVAEIIASMVPIPGKDYMMGKTEVTQKQFKTIMAANPLWLKNANPSFFKGPNSPVGGVSWSDCQEFLVALNALPGVKESGLVFRLPSMEEWKYACAAGAESPTGYCRLADGTEITEKTLGRVAWYKDNSDETPHPVAQKEPNAFGLYDMLGNVAEWTQRNSPQRLPLAGGSCNSDHSTCTLGCTLVGGNGGICRTGALFTGFRLCVSCASERTEEAVDGTESEEGNRPSPNRPALLQAGKPVVEGIIASMVLIPGTNFRMGETEVTQAQWEAVMGGNPSVFKAPDNPVENISRDDCLAFVRTLNGLPAVKESGLVFRLPTSAEWKYACSAGASDVGCKLADGTEVTEGTLGRVAWFDRNSLGKPHPVGQKEPNAFGFYDMHGNVAEWTSNSHGKFLIIHGGGWFSPASDCLTDHRGLMELPYHTKSDGLGLRLCASGRAD